MSPMTVEPTSPYGDLLDRDTFEENGEVYRTVDPSVIFWRELPVAFNEPQDDLDVLLRDAGGRKPNPSRIGSEQIVSTDHRDRRGDIIRTEGIKRALYTVNPIVLLMHGKQGKDDSKYRLPVVGGNARLDVVEVEGLPGIICREWLFGDTELGREVCSLWNDGIIRAASIAVKPIEWVPIDKDGNHISMNSPRLKDLIAGVDIIESEMIEWSFVYRGMDPKALRRCWLEANKQTVVDMGANVRRTEARREAVERAAFSDTRAIEGMARDMSEPAVKRAEERRYSHVAAFVSSTPWAMLPAMLQTFTAILAERQSGHRPSLSEIRERIGAKNRDDFEPDATEDEAIGPVAQIEISGPIVPRGGMMASEHMSAPMRSSESIRADLQAALDAPAVKAILLNINSPGGSVPGTAETGAAIAAANKVKPVTAIANHMAASAAYWLGTQAGTLIASPSAEVGSIGVYSAHEDISAALEKEGVKITMVKAGKFKNEGNPYEPLSDDAKAEMQRKINIYHEQFISAVASGRDVSAGRVRSDFGQGRMLMAEEALDIGMIDSIATFEEVVAEMEAEHGTSDGDADADAGEVTILDTAAKQGDGQKGKFTEKELRESAKRARDRSAGGPVSEDTILKLVRRDMANGTIAEFGSAKPLTDSDRELLDRVVAARPENLQDAAGMMRQVSLEQCPGCLSVRPYVRGKEGRGEFLFHRTAAGPECSVERDTAIKLTGPTLKEVSLLVRDALPRGEAIGKELPFEARELLLAVAAAAQVSALPEQVAHAAAAITNIVSNGRVLSAETRPILTEALLMAESAIGTTASSAESMRDAVGAFRTYLTAAHGDDTEHTETRDDQEVYTSRELRAAVDRLNLVTRAAT